MSDTTPLTPPTPEPSGQERPTPPQPRNTVTVQAPSRHTTSIDNAAWR